jgi:integrase
MLVLPVETASFAGEATCSSSGGRAYGRFHLHGFRHARAAELYRGDGKLARIKRQLGHSSLAVTQNYLEDVLGIPEAIDELSQHRPTWRADAA